MNHIAERPLAVRFDIHQVNSAATEWGANCGPAAIAAILGKTLSEIRPYLGDFEKKGYTNPTLMYEALNNLCSDWRRREKVWPHYGLARIQWEGPWTAPGVPMAARYRHTHWVGAQRFGRADEIWVFDINCMCVGGWVPLDEWSDQVVPWLLKECQPKASGKWHITHGIEVRRSSTSEGNR
jgi:hypothetical protein